MFVKINNVSIYFESNRILNPSAISILFLHGFTGSSNDWNDIINLLPAEVQVVTIDLIGHGKSDSPKLSLQYSSEAMSAQINSIIENLNLEKVILVGYSMGGRAALTFQKKYPQRIAGLILESSSPGISNFTERQKRIENDDRLSAMIEKDGLEKFTEYWMSLPIFQSQKHLSEEVLKKIKTEKIKNNPTGLVNSLKGFGQGTMPHLWDDIQKIKCKVLLITGESDERYTQINAVMKTKMINAEHKIVANAGHNIHLEKPEVFVSLLKDFVKM
jgi:2-succinyl-6-hydroxy-2,4-cyclohexadiene-1-carboxylate synthase